MKIAHDLTLEDKIYYYYPKTNELTQLAIKSISIEDGFIVVKTPSSIHSPKFDIRKDLKASYIYFDTATQVYYFTDRAEALKRVIESINFDRGQQMNTLNQIDSKLNIYSLQLTNLTNNGKEE